MVRKVISLQIRLPQQIRDRAKKVASQHDMTLSELILRQLARAGDTELKSMIKQELNERPKPGRRW